MADFDIDTKALDRFKSEIDDLQRLFPKEAKQMMLRSGNKARSIVLKKANSLVRRGPLKYDKKGRIVNYHKRIKRGKVWSDSEGIKVRVFNSAPHALLIEYGHRIVTKKPGLKEVGFKEGYHVFDKAHHDIDSQWESILEQEFDRIMSKL